MYELEDYSILNGEYLPEDLRIYILTHLYKLRIVLLRLYEGGNLCVYSIV